MAVTLFIGCTNSNLAPSALYPLPVQTPIPVPTLVPFVIWQNGTVGCYQGNCLLDLVRLSTINGGPTTFQTNGNSLEWDSNGSNICNPSLTGYMNDPIDITPYLPLNGHLQMDIKLALTTASYGSIYIRYDNFTGNLGYALNLSLLSSTSFTHVSVPLFFFQSIPPTYNYFSEWTGNVFEIDLNCPNGPTYFPNSGPLLYVNNIQWTAN